MQRRAFFHAGVAHQPSLGEEVCGKLHRGAETSSDHGGANAAVKTPDSLAAVNLGHAVQGVLVRVLGANGEKRRKALEASLDEEEGRAGRGANDTRGGTAKHVDTEILGGAIAQKQRGESLAHGVVESEAAAIEQDLVDVCATDTAVDASQALVLDDDADAMDGAPIVVRLVAFVLQLALELHTNFDSLEGMGGGDGAAGRYAAGDECTVWWRFWLAYACFISYRFSSIYLILFGRLSCVLLKDVVCHLSPRTGKEYVTDLPNCGGHDHELS